jgi:hypothetical protein
MSTFKHTLLPLPEEEWNVRYGYYADTVSDYARACVAAAVEEKDAEIEALRAEVGALREALSLMVTTHDEGGWPTAAIVIARAAIAKATQEPQE